MSFPLWLTLLTASTVISFTPGAGAINTMGNSLAVGFRRSIWGILGQQAALVLHLCVVAAGVGVLVTTTPVLFDGIRYAGAAYLVYLGIRQFLAKPGVDAEGGGEADVAGSADVAEQADVSTASLPGGEGAWSMFRRGLFVNLSNPKAIVFFLAFLPQFIRPGQPLLAQYLIVGATIVVVDIAVMWGFFAAAAQTFRGVTRSARGQRVLNIVFGSLFIGVAALLAFVH
ncbi:lysine transporter LysE [Agromyces protaetiae]|uniref:Lysine transporter LysE n=1 Tax=Agromyces protaetiae TaxID=2509455 RepID=A0A4P6FBT9_9MICO|nr:LysE family transporter [Agromyces protaetiae]QAY73462.1 lysine transporter LysE [Agromyces protaetiae]